VFEEHGDPMEPISPQHRDFERELSREDAAKLRQMVRELLG
jgi:hypothetical protein